MEKKMWDAYAKQAGGVTFDGKPLPTWDELGEDRQACWKAAASVCADEIERLRKHKEALKDAVRKFQNRFNQVTLIASNYSDFADILIDEILNEDR